MSVTETKPATLNYVEKYRYNKTRGEILRSPEGAAYVAQKKKCLTRGPKIATTESSIQEARSNLPRLRHELAVAEESFAGVSRCKENDVFGSGRFDSEYADAEADRNSAASAVNVATKTIKDGEREIVRLKAQYAEDDAELKRLDAAMMAPVLAEILGDRR